MGVVAFDTETALIRPACLAPECVCLTWQRDDGSAPQIIHANDAESLVRGWLADPSIRIVGHNVAYDLAVICERFPALRPLVFAAYDADRITDTMIRQQLIDIAAGEYRGRIVGKGHWIEHKYHLEDLGKRCAGIVLQKDAWRMSYANFLDVPLTRWPERAREVQAKARERVAAIDAQLGELATLAKTEAAPYVKAFTKEREGLVEMIDGDPNRCTTYPLDDARATLAVYQAQEKHAEYLADQFRQARAAFALHLSSAWGLRTDHAGVAALQDATQREYDETLDELVGAGLIRANGVRDTKAAKARMVRVCKEEGLELRRTDTHVSGDKCVDAAGNKLPPGDDACVEHVALDADACDLTDDPLLVAYAKSSALKKVLSNDIPALLAGTEYPIHTRYGLAETGRTTSSKPNIQNWGRKGGSRETFTPRPSKVFFSCDYPQLELFTLAQCCVAWLGHSKLAEVLNAGRDPHLALAAQIKGVTYDAAALLYEAGDEEIADIRQLAKQANFGLPGGLGIPKFEKLVRKNLKPEIIERLGINAARLKQLKEQWFATFPEMLGYFSRVNTICDTPDGKGMVETYATKRFRGGATYCACCNNGFQALGVDCAKEALWRICHAQYVDGASALFNTRTVAFIHDEFLCEGDEATAHEAANELADLMVAGANHYLRDVPVPRKKVKPVVMRRWSKDAKPVIGVDGRLVPWTPLAA